MSVQFGRWNFDGMPVERSYLDKVKRLLAPYGPDDQGSYSNGSISIVYCAFHTTKESRREKQPHLAGSDAVIAWDGRLDNRDELISQLGAVISPESTDVAIVAAAYEQWRMGCFGMLIGDWALSIWEPRTRSLTLAKDPIGVRHLYYLLEDNQVTWSTVLDPLVLLRGRTFPLCEEYVAGWFSYLPAAHLTPYMGVQSVPPSSFVHIRNGSPTVLRYWEFDPDKLIHHGSDAEYEDHFRSVFTEAIRRRLRSDSPILAELSGGMDSSSVVCMADNIIAAQNAEMPRLETISYYNDSEPNWDERPFFATVEQKRGRVGCHIDLSSLTRFNFAPDEDHFASLPEPEDRRTEARKQFADYLASQGCRVVLSGMGGDEVMGGVPTPVVELQDLVVQGKLRACARQLKAWAIQGRVPMLRLAFATLRAFFPLPTVYFSGSDGPEAWLDPHFTKRNRQALRRADVRIRLFGPLPSFQANISSLADLQKQLAAESIHTEPLFEKSYPYLDRSLLEFIYAIPREQLVRPGRRRSLMRRALKDVVPIEILERRRKAYVSRSPVLALQMARAHIEALLEDALIVRHRLIDPVRFARFTNPILNGANIAGWPLLTKTIVFELWLRRQAKYLTALQFEEDRYRFTDTRQRSRGIRVASGSDSIQVHRNSKKTECVLQNLKAAKVDI